MKENVDYVIVGAGPGGLQMAYFLQKAGQDYVVLERGDSPAGFFQTFPRHRKLISTNKVYTGIEVPETNLRWDWNSLLCDDPDFLFKNYSREYFPPADALVSYLRDFAEHYKLRVIYNSPVTRISKPGEFVIDTISGQQLHAKRVIVATGIPNLRIPQFPGVEFAERYDTVSVNPDEFRNQKVMIVGKGNSGMETADNLSQSAAVIHMLSPNPVRMAWRTHYVGDLRAVNNNVLDTYQLKSQNTILDASIERIERSNDGKLSVDFLYTHAEQQRWTVTVDRVILCTGFRHDSSVFDPETCPVNIGPSGKFPEVTHEWESATVKDLYFAGNLMHGLDYRKSFSGFIHGFRYAIECLSRILAHKYDSVPLEAQTVSRTPEAVLSHLIERLNTNSSLYQLPAFFADTLSLRDETVVKYWRDLPVDYLQCYEPFHSFPILRLTMEYGKLGPHEDPFAVYRFPQNGSVSRFIHPVLRLLHGSEQLAEYHVPEDLENQWDKEIYTVPLLDFLRRVMERKTPAAVGN